MYRERPARPPFPIFRALGVVLALATLASGCLDASYDPTLPDSRELGSPRGYRVARVITHDHSPYSYDACDRNGLSVGTINSDCYHDLRNALCANRVDYLFLTDHPNAMASYPMDQLVLAEPGDHPLTAPDGSVYGNALAPCASGFTPTLMPGFESQLMAIAMDRHVPGLSATDLETLYESATPDLANKIRTQAGGLVFIPHTESRSLDLIRSIQPDAIEIYNIHANLDPKIRKAWLNLPPFSELSSVLSYLIDPYGDLNADQIFFQFLTLSPVYFQKWDQLIYEGMKVAGVGGTDSHENIFPQKASDRERLDSHRRMTRFMSNHLLVHDTTPAEVKSALKQGRGWLVFEGFGSPVGMDFYADTGAGTIGVSESASLGGGRATLHVRLPSIHPAFPHGKIPPLVRVVLKHVIAGGQDEVVATSTSSDVDYATAVPGAYRAEIMIRPLHLQDFLGSYANLAEQEFTWIITNHVYLNP